MLLIFRGSRAFVDFDSTLISYAFATVFATAAIVLPRAQPAPVTAFSPTAADLVRLDPARAAPEPHTRVDSPSASEPPV